MFPEDNIDQSVCGGLVIVVMVLLLLLFIVLTFFYLIVFIQGCNQECLAKENDNITFANNIITFFGQAAIYSTYATYVIQQKILGYGLKLLKETK
jgi:hypothetical protein